MKKKLLTLLLLITTLVIVNIKEIKIFATALSNIQSELAIKNNK